MKYLVLGSNSFAGSTFVNELLLQDACVLGISRSEQPNNVLCPYANNPNLKNFSFYQLDLNTQFDQVNNLIMQFKPQIVVDFANQGMVAESWQHPEQWYTTNIVAKAKLHTLLRSCDFLERFVRISTPEVYGHSEQKLTENAAYCPSTPYAVSQAATDMSLQAFYKQYQFPVIFTRFANFYGPYQQLYRIIPKAIISGMLKKKLPLHGGGLAKRAFIHGRDVSNAVQAALKFGKIGEIYHFSSGACISILELIEKICAMLQLEFQDLVEIAPERPGKDTQYFMETEKAQKELFWSETVSLETGISETIDWAAQHIDTIKTLPLHYIHQP